MKKLFGLFLLALAFLPSDPAHAANRFATCATTCTWDNTSTAMWGTVSGGTGASAPTSADAVIMDAATCVGGTTCTITTFAGTISAQSITWGVCTASTTGCIIDASVNNTNFTVSGSAIQFSGTGTGTRKWLAGSGTYTLSGNTANGCFSMVTATNDQGSVFSAATWICTMTTTALSAWNGGGFSFGPTTFNGNSSGGSLSVGQANTFASLIINAPNYVTLQNTITQTITGALTLNGSSNTSNVVLSSTTVDTPAVVSLGSASTGSWTVLRSITTSGAAALTASSCINAGRNTLANGGACNTPAGGGGGGGRIIGG